MAKHEPLAPRRLLQPGEVVGRIHTSDRLNIPHACGNALPHYPTPDCIPSPTSVASELSFREFDGMTVDPTEIDAYMMYETREKVVALWQEKKRNSHNDNNN